MAMEQFLQLERVTIDTYGTVSTIGVCHHIYLLNSFYDWTIAQSLRQETFDESVNTFEESVTWDESLLMKE
jgi:hypothetical protein